MKKTSCEMDTYLLTYLCYFVKQGILLLKHMYRLRS